MLIDDEVVNNMKNLFIDNKEKTFTSQFTQLFKEPQDINKSIRKRALDFFSDIIGNDAIKVQIYRALIQEDRSLNFLLCGPAATSKTLFMKIIEKKCNNVVFYDCATGSTASGLIEILRRNQNAKILLIDEVSEMKGGNLEVLRGLMSDGRISKTLKSQLVNFRMKNLKICATTNNPTKLSKPLKSRFQIYLINGYNNEEFVKVLTFCLLRQNIVKTEEMAKELSYAMLHYEIKNIRTALSVCSLIHEHDTHEDIKEVIENYIMHNGAECNIDFNTQEEENQ